MTWTPITREQMEFARHMVLWIRTAKAAGYPWRQPDWLPSGADVSKSALFERIRSGKHPLPEPPPVAHACPWYAVVEDPGPHFIGQGGIHGPYIADTPATYQPGEMAKDTAVIFQHPWRIHERLAAGDFIVGDGSRDTAYRFRLYHDPEWQHPSGRLPKGGWFLTRSQDHEAERIVAAAMRMPESYKDAAGQPLVHRALPPMRHDGIIAVLSDGHSYPAEAIAAAEQGFWTDRDRFVDRKEACELARAAGQIRTKHGPEGVLFSEDLW